MFVDTYFPDFTEEEFFSLSDKEKNDWIEACRLAAILYDNKKIIYCIIFIVIILLIIVPLVVYISVNNDNKEIEEEFNVVNEVKERLKSLNLEF